jgi:hypothetical protein
MRNTTPNDIFEDFERDTRDFTAKISSSLCQDEASELLALKKKLIRDLSILAIVAVSLFIALLFLCAEFGA